MDSVTSPGSIEVQVPPKVSSTKLRDDFEMGEKVSTLGRQRATSNCVAGELNLGVPHAQVLEELLCPRGELDLCAASPADPIELQAKPEHLITPEPQAVGHTWKDERAKLVDERALALVALLKFVTDIADRGPARPEICARVGGRTEVALGLREPV